MYYSACQDAIWGLDTLGRVFIRTLSPSCPTGMHWTKLDLAQLGMAFVDLTYFSAEAQEKEVLHFGFYFVSSDLKV